MGTINLGPFAFPVGALLLIGAALVALTMANRMGRSRGINLETHVWKVLIAGLLVARITFVALYWNKYVTAPLSIIDIRDGGFQIVAGFIAAAAMAAWSVWRERSGRRPLLFSIAAGALIWAAGTGASMYFYTGTSEVPDVTLTQLDGSPVQLKSLAGKPLVLNMWATWCPPCRREMPALRDAQIRYPDVVFVFANQGESAASVTRYLKSSDLVLENVMLDPKRQVAQQTGSMALPTTLFFDANGKFVGRRVGELSAATLAQRIESLQAR